MSAHATAQIIPFPTNPEARSIQVASAQALSSQALSARALSSQGVSILGAEPRERDEQQERLTRALASLDAALAEQRIAMSGWRESLDHLRKATTGLGLSMQRYHRTLGKLGTDVSDLHAKSVQLERWADKALTRHD